MHTNFEPFINYCTVSKKDRKIKTFKVKEMPIITYENISIWGQTKNVEYLRENEITA